MDSVFVLDKRKKPLMPCSERRARLLLERGRAVVHSRYPFTIRLRDRTLAESELQPIRLKIDPGATTTGMAVIRVGETAENTESSQDPVSLPQEQEKGRQEFVLLFLEIAHRGLSIRDALLKRAGYRRNRRGRKTRYRAPRFLNRTRPKGWLPPSLQHRIDTILAWVRKLSKLCPITEISVEGVRFDTQLMENPEVSGTEYQQGTLAGYEVREYLLEKWGRCCAYCGKRDVPLQIDHIHPRARGGSNRVSNLTLACEACNLAKGARPVEEFLKGKGKAPVLERIQAMAKKPLAAATAVNATRTKLVKELKEHAPVEESTGGRTKYNRQRMGIPKTHALDAACVGKVAKLHNWENRATLVITCAGRGRYGRTLVNKHGARRTNKEGKLINFLPRKKGVYGFQTGDIVRADVPSGVKKGVHMGRVAIKTEGYFAIQTANGTIDGVKHTFCKLLQRNNGYGYSWRREPDRVSKCGPALPPNPHEPLCKSHP